MLKLAPFDDWAMSHERGISQNNLAAWGAFLPASAGRGLSAFLVLTSSLLLGCSHLKPIGDIVMIS
jgi:hypothetical protein